MVTPIFLTDPETARAFVTVFVDPASPGAETEFQRTTETVLGNGTPDAAAAETFALQPPERNWYAPDRLPDDPSLAWFYRARHRGPGLDPSAWTAWSVGVSLTQQHPPVAPPPIIHDPPDTTPRVMSASVHVDDVSGQVAYRVRVSPGVLSIRTFESAGAAPTQPTDVQIEGGTVRTPTGGVIVWSSAAGLLGYGEQVILGVAPYVTATGVGPNGDATEHGTIGYLTGRRVDALPRAQTVPRNPLANHAVREKIVMATGTCSYIAFVGNTAIYQNGVPIATGVAQGGTGTFSVTKGDLLESNKPVFLRESTGGNESIVPVSFAGTYFAFHSDRDQPHVIEIYAPYQDAHIELKTDDDDFSTPDDTLDVAAGAIGTLNVADSNANVHRIRSDAPIVCWKKSTGGSGDTDKMALMPAAHEVLYERPPDASGVIAEDGGTPIENANYFRHSARFVVGLTGDGAGGDADQGVPVELLSEQYAVDHDVAGYQIVAVEPCRVRVYRGAGFATFYDEHDLTAASRSNPVTHSEGSDSSGVPTASSLGGGPWLFVGTAPFYLRTNDPNDDEYPVYGFAAHARDLSQEAGQRAIPGLAEDGDLKANIDGDTEVQSGDLAIDDLKDIIIGTLASPSVKVKPQHLTALDFVGEPETSPRPDGVNVMIAVNAGGISTIRENDDGDKVVAAATAVWTNFRVPQGVELTEIEWDYNFVPSPDAGTTTLKFVLVRIADNGTASVIASQTETASTSGDKTVTKSLSEDSSGRQYVLVITLEYDDVTPPSPPTPFATATLLVNRPGDLEYEMGAVAQQTV